MPVARSRAAVLSAPSTGSAAAPASSGRRKLRSTLPLPVQQLLTNTRRSLESAVATFVVTVLRLLPLRVRARVRERFSVTGPLDYAGGHIRLMVDSEIECSSRLQSCRKEPETVAWIEAYVQPGDVVFDVGANVGAYSFVIDCTTGGRATVYAFEPSFSNYAQLCRNVFLNGAQARIKPVSAALSSGRGLMNLQMSSTSPGAALHTVGTETTALSQPVLCLSLDEFIRDMGAPPPNHIKIDVDGGERVVLEGARATLANRTLRSVLIEIDPGADGTAALALLQQAGFTVKSRHPHGTGGNSPINYVLVRSTDA
jgi:FkbM family methyltransferase